MLAGGCFAPPSAISLCVVIDVGADAAGERDSPRQRDGGCFNGGQWPAVAGRLRKRAAAPRRDTAAVERRQQCRRRRRQGGFKFKMLKMPLTPAAGCYCRRHCWRYRGARRTKWLARCAPYGTPHGSLLKNGEGVGPVGGAKLERNSWRGTERARRNRHFKWFNKHQPYQKQQ